MILPFSFLLYLLSIYNVYSFVIKGPFLSASTKFRSDNGICQTEGCRKAAQTLLENMDESVNPCDDFYQFVCGGYIAKRNISEDKSVVGTFSDIQENLNAQLKTLFERPLTGTEPTFVKMIKNMFDSCVNQNQIEESGSTPLKEILSKLGGWPVVEGESWDESNFDWLDALIQFRKLGFPHGVLFELYVFEDLKDNTAYTIFLDQASLGMADRSYLLDGLDDPATAAYLNMMIKTANKLGANAATSQQELMKVLNFETTIANYSLPEDERRDFSKMYNKYTVIQLQELLPQVDWMKYINGLFDEPIYPSSNVIVALPENLKQVTELIASTDKRTLANYMLWRVVLASIPLLSKEWKDLHQEYEFTVTGSSETQARWEECLGSFSEPFRVALGYYYVKNYFEEESKAKAIELVSYLRREFLDMLENLDWMDEITKNEAIEKAKSITAFVGYPEKLLDDALVLEYYKNINITSDNYFRNVLNMRKWEIDDQFSQLRKGNVKGDWKKHVFAAMVEAFYNPMENSIDIPAGILQMEFFNKDRPHYMNFGAIGYVIGHEITHGFDDVGRQFDKEGNNVNWWDETTDKLFRDKAQCIIDQYSNYTVLDGQKVNGVLTQGENIADNGGLKEAYRAYQIWVKEHSPEPKLPGLKYTPNQLFWMSAATTWCSKYRPEFLKLSLVSDPHSPPQFRVLGPMSNLGDFSDAFQCPIGSNMNPVKKCQVW